MNKTIEKDEMRKEYDFSKGVRGKHFAAYRRSTKVSRKMHKQWFTHNQHTVGDDGSSDKNALLAGKHEAF